jgi:excisionase family DNA binding protein
MELRFEDLPNAVSQILTKLERIESLMLGIIEKPQTDPEKPLNVREAAEFLGFSIPTIYGLMHQRAIPYMKPGRRCYFLKSELINYLKDGRRKTYKEIEIEAENYIMQRKMKKSKIE